MQPQFLIPYRHKNFFFLNIDIGSIMIDESHTLSLQPHLIFLPSIHQCHHTLRILIMNQKMSGLVKRTDIVSKYGLLFG